MSRRRQKPPRRIQIPIQELNAIVERTRDGALPEAEQATLRAAVDTLARVTAELESTQTTLERVRRIVFGSPSERTAAVLGEEKTGERPLADAPTSPPAAAGETAPGGAATGTADTAPRPEKKKRPGHGRNGAEDYPRAPRIAVAHARLKHGDPCPEPGCEGRLYVQRRAPALLVRVTGVAPLAAQVYELERLRCGLCGTVFTAEPPAGVGETKYDETAAAMIALLKYGCGLPFHRIARLEKALAIPLPAATQWEVVQQAAARLTPAFAELAEQAAEGSVLYNDDTTMRILNFTEEARTEALPPGARADRTGVFTSGLVAETAHGPIALFKTGPCHAGEHLAEVLDRREAPDPPIQMSDGLSRNKPGDHPTQAASCLPHARRKYVDVANAFPDEVAFVLKTLREVFRTDQQARRKGLSPPDRLLLHQQESAPRMQALEDWMASQFAEHTVEPHSGLGQAISYMQNHWQKLTLFRRVAGAPIDNNICERILKKAILHRKNALFYRTLNGARVGDLFMSLILSAAVGRNQKGVAPDTAGFNLRGQYPQPHVGGRPPHGKGGDMDIFLKKHQESILGVVEGFDRIIFKGYLSSMFPDGAFARYLSKRGVLLKNAAKFFERETEAVVQHAKTIAAEAGRPYRYLASAHTHASGRSKEAMARAIAEQDEITEGLVCIFSVIEPCVSFAVAGNRQTQRLEVVRRNRRCLHLYWYLIDPVFGWMHVRIQTWAPYATQIYVNGREWLCRQLPQVGVAFERSDNKIVWVSDFEATAKLAEQFNHTDWPALLIRQVARVNPLLPAIAAANFDGYWFGIDQAEVATDLLFKSRADLERIHQDLIHAAITGFGATDVMRFLGQKPHHAFTGEVAIDRKKRPEGCRIKFRIRRNSVKFYDHLNVLRIETTLNHPAEFKILTSTENAEGQVLCRWSPMRQGVSNFWRYAQAAHGANSRLIDALANAPLQGQASEALDRLCRSQCKAGRQVAAFNPVTAENVALFNPLSTRSGQVIHHFRL